MNLVNPITSKPLNQYHRNFAICESCFWCATIFHTSDERSNNSQQQQQRCPICENKSVSLTPLAKDEGYKIAMEPKRRLEIEFLI